MARRRGEGEPRKPRKPASEAEDVLRAKYLDYCSALLCDVFMELEEERVFELARTAEQRAGVSAGELGFRAIADLLVEKLMDDLALPDFRTWAEDYQENPQEYDPYLLGLWKTMVESPVSGGR